MPKGMFTQGVCVLLDRQAAIGDMETALAEFDVRARRGGSEQWEFGGPTFIVAYRPECNGFIAVDAVEHSWPDHMGDPKNEPMLFAAWSMGHFGPFAYPGGLRRAAQQCWSWSAGRTIPDRQKAFVRIRASYAFGAKQDDPVLPADYEPMRELEFVTNVALPLLELPGSLCYFNPSGEVLRDQNGLMESLGFGRANSLPPLDVWSNVRLFKVNDEWSMMDTVGNAQFDIPDFEACFHSTSFDCSEVDRFLRNASLYVLENGEVIDDGDTMDGPGDIRWQSREFQTSICHPPRRVLRWSPLDDRPVPHEIRNAGKSA